MKRNSTSDVRMSSTTSDGIMLYPVTALVQGSRLGGAQRLHGRRGTLGGWSGRTRPKAIAPLVTPIRERTRSSMDSVATHGRRVVPSYGSFVWIFRVGFVWIVHVDLSRGRSTWVFHAGLPRGGWLAAELSVGTGMLSGAVMSLASYMPLAYLLLTTTGDIPCVTHLCTKSIPSVWTTTIAIRSLLCLRHDRSNRDDQRLGTARSGP